MINEAWVIALLVIVEVFTLLLAVYYLFIFVNRDDIHIKKYLFYKIFIIIGLILLQQPIIAFILDSSLVIYKLINISIFWSVTLYVNIVFILIVFPLLYYIFIRDSKNNVFYTVLSVILNYVIYLIIYSVIILASYFVLGRYRISYNVITSNTVVINDLLVDSNSNNINVVLKYNLNTFTVTFLSNFFDYIFNFFIFVGIFLFSLFFSISLLQLPKNLILEFIRLPKIISNSSKKIQKEKLIANISTLISYINKISIEYDEINIKNNFLNKKRKQFGFKNKYNKLVSEYNHLEDEILAYKELYIDKNNQSIILIYLKFMCGILLSIINIIIVVDIILILSHNETKCVFNLMIKAMMNNVGLLFGTMFIYLFSLLIMLYNYYGNYIGGGRLLFFIEMYPMKIGRTLIPSFFINLIYLYFSIFPLIIYLNKYFNYYTIGNNFNATLYNIQKRIYLNKYILQDNIYLYIILIFLGIQIVYTIFKKIIIKIFNFFKSIFCCCIKKKPSLAQKVELIEIIKLK